MVGLKRFMDNCLLLTLFIKCPTLFILFRLRFFLNSDEVLAWYEN
jgi:hypothetical protein